MDKTEKHPMEDHTVTLNEVDLHYRTIGDGPVLFLVSPGWGVASGYLQRAFSSLAKHLRLVFIDTRGGGLSGRPAILRACEASIWRMISKPCECISASPKSAF